MPADWFKLDNTTPRAFGRAIEIIHRMDDRYLFLTEEQLRTWLDSAAKDNPYGGDVVEAFGYPSASSTNPAAMKAVVVARMEMRNSKKYRAHLLIIGWQCLAGDSGCEAEMDVVINAAIDKGLEWIDANDPTQSLDRHIFTTRPAHMSCALMRQFHDRVHALATVAKRRVVLEKEQWIGDAAIWKLHLVSAKDSDVTKRAGAIRENKAKKSR